MNGPKQHRSGEECALCSAHNQAALRHKTIPPDRRQRLVRWAVAFTVAAFAVPFLGEEGLWVALGLCAGLAGGAGIALLDERTNLHFAAATLAEASEELKAEADQRVAMVIRQFEWAVNDVANLRDALKRAQDSKSASEASEQRVRRRLHMLERQLYDARLKMGEYSRALGSVAPSIEEPAILPATEDLLVPLTWHVFEENMLTWLRFESVGILPSQVRILNEHDAVIAISARSLDELEDGEQVSLLLRAPDDVVASLEGRHAARFKFEALVDDTWCKVELAPAQRQAHVEKHGRARRSENDHRSQALIA